MERNKQSTIAVIICIAVLTLCPPAPAKVIYVDDDAPAGGDGHSWQTAYRYLQDALKDVEPVPPTEDEADPCCIGEESVLGAYRFTGSGGSSGYHSTAVFSLHAGREYQGPYFKVIWEAGPEDIGRSVSLQIQGNPDPNAAIVGSLLTNGVCDPIAFQGGGGGRSGTDCTLFTKSPGIESTYGDFRYYTVTRIDMTVNALKLDHSDASRTDMECDVTFAICGYPNTSCMGGLTEIRVAQGLYKPDQGLGQTPGDRTASFKLLNDVLLKGAYAGIGTPDPGARDVKLYQTVLSGDLAGDDIDVSDPCDLWRQPSRSENAYHVVTASGTDPNTLLEGFTIAAGNAYEYRFHPEAPNTHNSGAGLRNDGGSPLVHDCTFLRNVAEGPGGGMCNKDGASPHVVGCEFLENAARDGGGVFNEDSEAFFENCLFQRNWTFSAGTGMYNDTAKVDCHQCSFVENAGGSASAVSHVWGSEGRFTECRFIANYGKTLGALVLGSKCDVTLVDCVFRANQAGRNGGAIFVDTPFTMIAERCSFVQNTATSGGAIYVSESPYHMYEEDVMPLSIHNCLFSGNSAMNGGAIHSRVSKLTVGNCTFSGNHADRGRAILTDHYDKYRMPGYTQISNCILWDEGGNEIATLDDSPISVSYCNVSGSRNSVYDPCSVVVWGVGNLDVNPSFADPGYWDPNSTADDPNDDFWVDGDYHLKSQAGRWDLNSQRWVIDDVTSPCIDAGDPNSLVGEEPSPNGRRINMGAYGGTVEASKSYPFKTFQEMLQGLLATIEGQSDEAPLIYKVRGYLHFIMAPPGTHFAVDQNYRGTAEEAANWFQRHWRDLFVNPSNAVSFEISRISTSGSNTVVRYRQKYAGLEVYAAEMIVDVGADGGVEAVISDIESDTSPLDKGEVSLTPSIDAATAQEKGIAFFAKRYKGTTLQASPPVLMVYAPSVLSNTGPIRLVWNMEVWSTSGGTMYQRALVDAHDGQVALSFSLIHIR